MSDRSSDTEMDEEMAHHLALLAERKRAAGMSADEALRAARVQFGGREVIKETARAQRRYAWAGDAARDVAFGLRLLGRTPAFTAILVGTLALGIGASTAIFSIVDSVLLTPLDYPRSEQLVAFEEIHEPDHLGGFVRPEPFQDWRTQATSFQGIAAVRMRSYNLSGGGEPVRVSGARITANTFSVLGVSPLLGRDFLAEEDVAGRGNVVILSHAFWTRRFGGRGEALFATLQLDGQPFTVVGVMPKGFDIDRPIDLFVPAAFLGDPEFRRSVGAQSVLVLGRMAAGVTPDQAQREMSVIARRRESLDPRNEGWGVKVTPLLESRVGDARPLLYSLLGAVGFLLLITYANAANLLLARAATRSGEMAVRAALGAGRGRMIRQLLTENIVVAMAAGLVGVLLAQAGSSLLLALAPESLPRAQEIAIDARVLGFTCVLTLATGIAFGLAPALGATRRGNGRAPRPVLRGAPVVTQIAVALVLLVGAGLLMRSFVRRQEVQRGFRPEGALTFSLALPMAKYGAGVDARIAAFADQATAAIAAVPGVEAVGATQSLPFSVDMNVGRFEVVGRPAPAEPPTMYLFECTPGYLQAMGIRLLRGRRFDGGDDAQGPRVAIINESMARRYFGDENPIGKRIAPPGHPERGGAIVGVVNDVRDGRLSALAGAVANQVYVPLAQNPYEVLTFVVRVRPGAPAGLPIALQGAIRRVDPHLPIGDVRPLADWVSDSVARYRFATLLFIAFSAAALLLAAIGVYGVVAFAVTDRAGEIAIRIALGARDSDVLGLFLREGARLVAIGVAAGTVGALVLTRALSSLLFGVTAQDPATFALVAASLGVVVMLACVVPAARATRVDPMIALRAE